MFRSFEKTGSITEEDSLKEEWKEAYSDPERETLQSKDLLAYSTFFEAFNDENDDDRLMRKHLESLLSEGNFGIISKHTQTLLIENGVQEAEGLDPLDPAVALALAEAVNLAAKSIDYRFYQIKSAMIISAWKIGNRFGYNKDDSTYNLFHPDLGTASFHDPGDEIYRIVRNTLDEHELIPEWEHEWSGITRQELAFRILESLRDLKLIEESIEQLIRETTPQPLIGADIDFQSGKTDAIGKIYGSGSIQVKLRDLVLQSEDKQLKALLLRCAKLSHSSAKPE